MIPSLATPVLGKEREPRVGTACTFNTSPIRQTRRRIFAIGDSNDAESRKDVHFGVSLTMLSI